MSIPSSCPPLVALLVEGVLQPRSSNDLLDSSRSSTGGTMVLELPHSQLHDVGSIKRAICARTPYPCATDDFFLTLNGRILHERTTAELKDASTPSSTLLADLDDELSSSSMLVLRVVHRGGLLGGKGGFGSLLRATTTKVGAKKTSNFSASRDLNGRRMRHVDAERQLAEWNAAHHAPVDEAALAAKYKAIKEGRPMEVKECKWGPTCKYRYTTCRRQHGPDPNAADEEKNGGRVLTMAAQVPLRDDDVPLTVSSARMESAVTAGLQSTKGQKRTRAARAGGAAGGGAAAAAAAAGGDEERKEQEEDDDDDDDQQQSEDDEDEDELLQDGYSSSDSEDERAAKRQHTGGGAASASAAAAAGYSTSAAAASPAAAAAGADNSSTGLSFSALAARTYVAPLPRFPALSSHAIPAQLDQLDTQQVVGGVAAVLAKVKAKEMQQQQQPASAATSSRAGANAAAASAPAAAADAAASFDPIDLSSIPSAAELQSRFSAAHLGHELARLGLKAGGTHEQKAQRLFLLRDTPLDKLPKKLLAAVAS
jgi:hypothetical protein